MRGLFILSCICLCGLIYGGPQTARATEILELRQLIESRNCRVRSTAIDDIIRIAKGKSRIGIFTALAFAPDFRCQAENPVGFVIIPDRMYEVILPKFDAKVVRYVKERA